MIRVTFDDAALTIAIVTTEPAWWRRLLFGEQPSERCAVRVKSLFSFWTWAWAFDGRPVEGRELEALIEARAKAIAALPVDRTIVGIARGRPPSP